MSLLLAVLAVTLTSAQMPDPSTEVVAPAWSVGVAGGVGLGFRLGQDSLQAELRRTQASKGEPANAKLDNMPLAKRPLSVRVFADGNLQEFLSVGVDLGVLIWDPETTDNYLRTQLAKYGVVAVHNQQSSSATAMRLGPRLCGKLPIAGDLSVEASMAGGVWLTVLKDSTPKPGWWVRPAVGAEFAVTDWLGIQLDLVYVYMPMFDKHPDALRGVETEVGVALSF